MYEGERMKHLISATLSLEAGQVWESWPKGQRSLRGNIATHRRRILAFLAEEPPLDEAFFRMFVNMIVEMNEDLDGSIHHDPIIHPD